MKVIIYITITVVVLIGYIKYIEIHSIFFPLAEIEFTPEFINLTYEDVYIETKDNIKINGWFIPHLPQDRIGLGQEGAGFIPHPNAKYTILFCHGNAGNIGQRMDKIDLLHQIGTNIFIIDYRGFGRSQGRPSEDGIYIDAQAAYGYLVNIRHIKPENIILYGESLGGAVAVDLASKVKVMALIVEGTFSRGRDMAKRMYPFLPSILFSHKFDSLKKIKEVKVPKLFIHSKDDEIVPLNLAKRLFNAACEPKYFVEMDGGHNEGFLESQGKYTSSIASFIEKL